MTAFSRRLVAETRLDTADLIWPLFVIEGNNITQPVDTMPGVSRYSIDRLLDQAATAVEPDHSRHRDLSLYQCNAER